MFLRTRLVWFYFLSLLSSSIYPSAHLIMREEYYEDHYNQPMSFRLQIVREEEEEIEEEESCGLITLQTLVTDVIYAPEPIAEPTIIFIEEEDVRPAPKAPEESSYDDHDDFATLQMLEHEAQEKTRQEVLLEKYGHKYQTSPELSAKLQAAQQAQSKPDTRSIFEKTFYTRPEVLEERAVRSQIFQERSSWRQRSLTQAEQQEKADILKKMAKCNQLALLLHRETINQVACSTIRSV